MVFNFLFFKKKTAYEMRISDWSSDVCSSDLHGGVGTSGDPCEPRTPRVARRRSDPPGGYRIVQRHPVRQDRRSTDRVWRPRTYRRRPAATDRTAGDRTSVV